MRLRAPAEEPSAGFTLIEVLVALSIVAIALSSMGALIASTARGERAVADHLTRLQVARTVLTALPDRNALQPGQSWGKMSDHSWRIDVSPFPSERFGLTPHSRWIPQTIRISIQSANGGTTELSTVRLQQAGAP